ncbi:MAG: cytochrome bc complex cytochrome b subunit [Methanomassiliicoccales archaeon]
MFSKKPKLFVPPKKGAVLGPDPMHIDELPLKRVPDYMRRRHGIWYWTGALISATFIYQVVTGLLLLLYYVPSDAYGSTESIIQSIPYGSLILTTHLYGAYAMVFLVYVHMFRNYFFASYKKPRQLQWVSGVILLALTIGVGYFGYSMSGDVLSVDATDVGRGIAGASPFIGQYLDAIFFGNGTSTSLFTHMLAWHIILAALIGLLFGGHFWLAEANGFMPSHRKTGHKAPAIDKESPDYKPWYPYNMVFIIQLGMFCFGLLFIIPSVLGLLALRGSQLVTEAGYTFIVSGPGFPALFSPFPQVPPTAYNLAAFVPTYPPWFLLFVYKAVDFEMFNAAGAMSALSATIVFAVIPLVYFLILPFIDTNNETHPFARPLVTSFGILGIIYMIILSVWGALSPGIPIPTPEVLAVLVPPFVVVVAGMFMLNRLYKSGRLRISSNKIVASFLIFILIMLFAAYSFGQGFVSTLAAPSGINALATIFSGGVLVVGAVGTMRSAKMSTESSAINRSAFSQPVIGKNTALVLSGIIMVGCIVIAYYILGLNPVGALNDAEFGVGLGFILILAGIIVRIYRAAFYHE